VIVKATKPARTVVISTCNYESDEE